MSGRFEGVDREFERSMQRLRDQAGPLTVLFSGGVDSSLIAHALRGHPDLELLTIGTASSVDLAQGEESARRLGLPWRGVRVGVDELRTAIAVGGADLDIPQHTLRSVAVSFAVAVGETRASRVVTAQGADELFLGYAHFRGLAEAELEDRYRRDLALLSEHEWPRAVRIADRLHRVVLAPFLEPGVRSACESVPLVERAAGPGGKPWLRAWAKQRGLPLAIADRPKKALQYSSGIDRLLRSYTA